jgi:hypothetical protein
VSTSKWRRALRDLADEVGAVLEHTRGGHFALVHPVDGWRVVTSSTPSDQRSLLHTRAEVRRQISAAYYLRQVMERGIVP